MLIVYLIFVFVNIRVHSSHLPIASDSTNAGCLSNEEFLLIQEYNKLEIVNNLLKRPLAELLLHKESADNIPQHNHFLHCVWSKEKFLTPNDEINYNKLEQIIKDAIVEVVGNTGPAINLCISYAKQVINECKLIAEHAVENKILKVQNHIVKKLQPFARV